MVVNQPRHALVTRSVFETVICNGVEAKAKCRFESYLEHCKLVRPRGIKDVPPTSNRMTSRVRIPVRVRDSFLFITFFFGPTTLGNKNESKLRN